MLSLNLDTYTSSPASIGVSIDYQNFTSVDVYPGTNVIPLGNPSPSGSVVRINAWDWQDNQILLQNLVLNSVCSCALRIKIDNEYSIGCDPAPIPAREC